MIELYFANNHSHMRCLQTGSASADWLPRGCKDENMNTPHIRRGRAITANGTYQALQIGDWTAHLITRCIHV